MIFPGLEEIEIITDTVEEKESRCLAKAMQRESNRPTRINTRRANSKNFGRHKKDKIWCRTNT